MLRSSFDHTDLARELGIIDHPVPRHHAAGESPMATEATAKATLGQRTVHELKEFAILTA